MKRNSTSLMGALHPVFFMLMVYAISVFMAFFVCNVVYNSLHKADSLAVKDDSNIAHLTVLK
ncbi:hypothetical protein [Flavisolibacter nicotianae]|uniref:hypothetical protein n=1 Tax=Flavisolibacter nicotianae TaxID=2364882 RepID=UPI0013C4727B|nr:hypothetical protein [Flavisolibacter nicotianae]